jgi:putative acetyltransferase
VNPDGEVTVRCERTSAEERRAIHAVNEAAFGRRDEADLVDRLRTDGVTLLSLVAEAETGIAGHLVFSRMSIVTAGGSVPAVALAPMAVLPAHQRRGIGGRMIRRALEMLRERGERIVMVVGHPDYYPRFGFSSEMARCLKSPFPPEVLMAIELSPGALEGVRGRLRYPDAFGL